MKQPLAYRLTPSGLWAHAADWSAETCKGVKGRLAGKKTTEVVET